MSRLIGSAHSLLPLLLALTGLLEACAVDAQQQRVETLKDRVAAFYAHLQANRVGAAIIENERIEAMAGELGQRVVQRHRERPGADNEVDRDWVLLTATREAAADNWLALARYFVRTNRFEEARGTYERVLSTYNDGPFQRYAEQARRGLKDLELMLPAERRPS